MNITTRLAVLSSLNHLSCGMEHVKQTAMYVFHCSWCLDTAVRSYRVKIRVRVRVKELALLNTNMVAESTLDSATMFLFSISYIMPFVYPCCWLKEKIMIIVPSPLTHYDDMCTNFPY